MNKMYKRIKDLREDHDYKQEYIAKRLNISQRAYSHYEQGTRGIPINILIKIADIYNVSVDYILERTNNPHIND